MRIVELKQDTPEWHAFRRNGIGSSEIHDLMNCEPFGPYWQALKREKLSGEINTFQSEAMKRGKEEEPRALSFLLTLNKWLEPKCAMHDDCDMIRCSFDATDGKVVHEIKTPMAKVLEECLMGRPPQKWISQLRWQMMIADVPRGFLEFWDTHSCHPYEVERDLNWDAKAIKVALQFWEWVHDGKLPEERYSPVEDPSKSADLQRLIEIRQIRKQLEEEEDKLKERICEGIDFNFILDGVKVYQTSNTSYDYKKMVADFKIALDSYKKQSKPYWKISL